MLALPLSRPSLPLPRPLAAPAEPRVAVLLNAHARRVSPQVVEALGRVTPSEDLFLSRSELDTRRIVQTVLERGYTTVFLGGGDGTFVGFVNEFLNQVRRPRFAHATLPRMGVLKLGTGNGLAGWVNASPLAGGRFVEDVLRARAGEVPGYRRLDLVEIDGKRAPFAGLGVDGQIINDYLWVREQLAQGALKSVFTGPGGYFSAIALRTVPHYLGNSVWFDCEVTNASSEDAYRLGHDGQVAEIIPPGGTLHSGRLMMAAAGTMPFYGYGVRMFPHAARRAGFMQLRLAAVTSLEVLANLHKLWNGSWRGDRIRDFHCKDVSVRFARPMPFQLGGDAQGYREELRMSVSSQPVELVDFTGALH
ncbi:MAG: hypothetical protein RL653_3143 [Pseudomonadota bacterium]